MFVSSPFRSAHIPVLFSQGWLWMMIQPAMLAEYDLIGFGSGIYYGKHHKTLLDFVAGLPQQG
jgi:hypothetical protein